MTCSCKLGCQSRIEMRFHHGTPEKYERALIRAAYGLMITMSEARQAANAYRKEYLATPERLP